MRILLVPALAAAAPAVAQDTAPPPAIEVTGAATVTTDYRFRGISQSDADPAVQGSLSVHHESGVYAGAFASTLSRWGRVGGADAALDLTGGYRRTFGTTTLDGGVTWYLYPGGHRDAGIVELFGRVTGELGPASLTAGVAYAPRQDATSRRYRTAADYSAGAPTARKREDNLYLTGDAVVGVPNTRFTGRAHIGWSHGNDGLARNGFSLSPTGEYWDWSLGADWNFAGRFTLGARYVDTDISKRESVYLAPRFRASDGGSIAGPTLLLSLSAAF